MLNMLTFIFACQLAGELTTRALSIPVPGPVLGMVLLFLFLLWRGAVPDTLAATADGLLRHLSLLFVPAGVGVMLHARLLGEDWLAIGVALVVSTVLTIAVTAMMMAWLTRNDAGDREQ
ncbi:MAG: CidA/LrgA family protein [Rhodobiaceae bacterium]|nr:CidA/LrgA family protein [Rhodobiaceae bacterium]